MSMLTSDVAPHNPTTEISRQLDPGTVSIRRSGNEIGLAFTEQVSSTPPITIEHLLVRPGFPPTESQQTQLREHAQQATDKRDFFAQVRATYPTEAASFTYDLVFCRYHPAVPDGTTEGSGIPPAATARVVAGGALQGFVFVRPRPEVPGGLEEHWALAPTYQPPAGSSVVTLAPLIPGQDDDVIAASDADAFLQAMYSRQAASQESWTWVKGTVTRRVGIPE